MLEEDKILIENSDDIFGIMQKVLLRENKLDRLKEHFWIVCLSAANVILNIELVSLGGATATIVDPKDVFRFAIVKGAQTIIAVHNHPSEELKPSEDDIDLTDRIIQAGKLLEVKVLDHLIISTKNYFSFLNEGLMKKLQKSKYILPYKLKEQMYEYLLNEDRAAYHPNKFAIIKNSLSMELSPEQLSDLLKIPVEEIKEILQILKNTE